MTKDHASGGWGWAIAFSPLFSKSRKVFQRADSPVANDQYATSSLINSADSPVANDNKHLNFRKFVKIEKPKTGRKLNVFQNI